MDKYGIPEEVAGALIDGMQYICFRLDRIYSKQEEFSPIAKLLLELSLSKRKDQENLVLEDLFNATDDVIAMIDDLELFLDSKPH